MSAVHIRAYQPTDFETLYGLDVLCFEPPFRFSRAMLRRVIAARGARTHVAVVGGRDAAQEIVGFCCVQPRPSRGLQLAYVNTLDVHPGHRRAGLGRRLMQAAEEASAAAGAVRMALHVFAGNAAAVALYGERGYRSVKRVADFYGAGLDGVLLVKALLPSGAEPIVEKPGRG